MTTKNSLKNRLTILQQTNWGVPNYQEESEYPKPNDLDGPHWRWEFLRRYKDVREEWLKHYKYSYEWNCKNGRNNSDEEPIPDPNHPKFLAHFYHYLGRVDSLSPEERERIQESIAAFKKFGLEGGLPNPSIRNPAYLSFSNGHWNVLDRNNLREVTDIKGDICIICFDLNRPINPQIELTNNFLAIEQALHLKSESTRKIPGKKKKTSQRRMNQKLWPQYLRILDARNDGKTFEWIGREILKLKKFDYDTLASEAKKSHQIACDLGINFPN